MTDHLLTEITVFILAVFVGIEVIGRVPSTLHTPLMSATNAIHGIVLVGRSSSPVWRSRRSAGRRFILIVLASLNVFGGYTVTERMLSMFRRGRSSQRRTTSMEVVAQYATWYNVAYLITGILFILVSST